MSIVANEQRRLKWCLDSDFHIPVHNIDSSLELSLLADPLSITYNAQDDV